MKQPSYYAIIPANIRYNTNISANAKLLYGEITALTNKEGKCWATNSYFAKLYNVSKTSISKWIKNLADEKALKIELVYKEGTKEILHRYITILQYPIEEKLNTPIEEKLKDNIYYNTTNTTSKNNTRVNIEDFLNFLHKDIDFDSYLARKKQYHQFLRSKIRPWAKYFIEKRESENKDPLDQHFLVYKNSFDKYVDEDLKKFAVKNMEKLPH